MTPANPDALADALARALIEDKFAATLALRRSEAFKAARLLIAGPLAPLLADLQRVTAERDEALATDRESVRKRLIEAHRQLWNIDADGELPTRARDKNPPDTLRAVAERAVQMLEEIRAEDAAKGRPWWGHTLANFVLDDLVYALAELPDPEAALTAAEARAAQIQAEVEALKEEHARYRASAEEMWELAEKRRADTAEASLATANAELARLRAEGEAMRAVLTTVKAWIDTDLPAGTSRAGTVHRAITNALGRAALAAQPEAPEAQGAWRFKAADEIDAIADLWSGDGRSYAKTIAAILRAEEPEQLPPADAETTRQVQRAWDRFKAGTSAPPSSSGQKD